MGGGWGIQLSLVLWGIILVHILSTDCEWNFCILTSHLTRETFSFAIFSLSCAVPFSTAFLLCKNGIVMSKGCGCAATCVFCIYLFINVFVLETLNEKCSANCSFLAYICMSRFDFNVNCTVLATLAALYLPLKLVSH